jgi:hypothetical protein
MRLLISGSREWDLAESINSRIVESIVEWRNDHPTLGNGPINWLTIVHGNCPRGADFLADQFASRILMCDVERYDADWRSFGRGAGHRRNARMINSIPDVCLFFIRDNSPGTIGCRKLAKAKGIPYESFYYPEELEKYGF